MVSRALEIDDREIGVVADSDAALAGDAEQAVGAVAGHVDEALEAHSAGVDVIEHDRHERLHAGHAGMAVRIGWSFSSRVCGAWSEPRISATPFATPAQMPVAVRGVAHRRVHLRIGAEAAIGGLVERQVVRGDLDGGDVLVVGQKDHLVGGGDVQDVDALAGRRAMRQGAGCSSSPLRTSARPGGSTDRPGRAGACAPRADTRLRSGRRRGGKWRDRMASTPASSATSRLPVEEPMNTLTPAQPGSFSSSGRSRRSRGCRRHKRRSRSACGRCARRSWPRRCRGWW
jgi:hypothetical protein